MRVLALAAIAVALAGCGSGREDASLEPRTVVASFYPLAWVTQQVANPTTTRVVTLTPPGVEPHDVELSPRDVETVDDAELVVYLGGGFQPAVEDAVAARSGRSLDLLRSGEDPHVWLDPIRFSTAVERVSRALGAAGSARGVLRDLKELDGRYRRGLRRCERRSIVTTHAAFGQLAARYGLTQIALAGPSLEYEPAPRELERLIDEVRESGATTVFTEPLASDRVARTVAREAGVDVRTLDPIEGLSAERSRAGEDYLSVMRANLAVLREVLGCR
jgi:zinc transport system substrate-binding protein